MIYGQYLHGVLIRGRLQGVGLQGYRLYSMVCPYCNSLFESTILQIKPKTGRKQGKDHCGCQSLHRRATRVGVPPTNKLDDKTRTVTSIMQSYKGSSGYRGLEFSLSKEELESLIFGKCHYCGIEPTSGKPIGQGQWKRIGIPTNGIDRINSDLGYNIDNVVSCCTGCNYFKLDKSKGDFLYRIKAIYENLNLQDIENRKPNASKD